MSAEKSKDIIHVSDSSMTAVHEEPGQLVLSVAPTDEEGNNTCQPALVPFASTRYEDGNFLFDSSFVMPFDLTFNISGLKKLLEKYPGSKLSIFGHADPVGNEEYNKRLSGRRAMAIYGMLVREINLWRYLYSTHYIPGDDHWGVKPIQIMLYQVMTASLPANGICDDKTKQCLKDFEERNGLSFSGFDEKVEISDATFRKLAEQYMDKICIDDDDNPYKLNKEDFLAESKGKDYKATFQGCGEANPLLIFSNKDKERLDKVENIEERNRKNSPNRRVMILAFPSDTKIEWEDWPCPTIYEGVDKCKKRYWSNTEKRLSNQEKEREFKNTHDTYGCRFYQRLLNDSEVEETQRGSIRIWLLDNMGQRMPVDTPYRLTVGSQVRKGKLSQEGLLVEESLILTQKGLLEWGVPYYLEKWNDSRENGENRGVSGETGEKSNKENSPSTNEDNSAFRYIKEVFLTIDSNNALETETVKMRLHNLGYLCDDSVEESLLDFKKEYGANSEEIDHLKIKLLDIHRNGIQKQLRS